MRSLHSRQAFVNRWPYSETTLCFEQSFQTHEISIPDGVYEDMYSVVQAVSDAMENTFGGRADLTEDGYVEMSCPLPFEIKTGQGVADRARFCPLLARLGFDTQADFPIAIRHRSERHPYGTFWITNSLYDKAESVSLRMQNAVSATGGRASLGFGVRREFALSLDFMTGTEKERLLQWTRLASDGRKVKVFTRSGDSISATFLPSTLKGSASWLKRKSTCGEFWSARLEFRKEDV